MMKYFFYSILVLFIVTATLNSAVDFLLYKTNFSVSVCIFFILSAVFLYCQPVVSGLMKYREGFDDQKISSESSSDDESGPESGFHAGSGLVLNELFTPTFSYIKGKIRTHSFSHLIKETFIRSFDPHKPSRDLCLDTCSEVLVLFIDIEIFINSYQICQY